MLIDYWLLSFSLGESMTVTTTTMISHDEQSRRQTYPCQFFLSFIHFSLQLGYDAEQDPVEFGFQLW